MHLRNADSADFEEQNRYAGDELEAISRARNYYNWIFRHFVPWLSGSVLEIGAGIGTCSEHIRRVPSVDRLLLVEPDPKLATSLLDRFEAAPDVEVHSASFGTCDFSQHRINAAVLVNVLEHVKDDQQMLKDIHKVLAPGGAVLLFVPGLPCLYGSLDREFGHYRRYTPQLLQQLTTAAGFQIQTLTYMNQPGAIAWYLLSRVFKARRLNSIQVTVYDRFVVPMAAWIESRHTPRFGQSLVAVAQKRATS